MSRTYRHSKTHRQFFSLTEDSTYNDKNRSYYELLTDNLRPLFKSEMSKQDRRKYSRKVRKVAKLQLLKGDECYNMIRKDTAFLFN